MEVTFWSRSEERGAGGVGGVGGEDAHGSRSCSVGDHFGVGPRVGDTVGPGVGDVDGFGETDGDGVGGCPVS